MSKSNSKGLKNGTLGNKKNAGLAMEANIVEETTELLARKQRREGCFCSTEGKNRFRHQEKKGSNRKKRKGYTGGKTGKKNDETKNGKKEILAKKWIERKRENVPYLGEKRDQKMKKKKKWKGWHGLAPPVERQGGGWAAQCYLLRSRRGGRSFRFAPILFYFVCVLPELVRRSFDLGIYLIRPHFKL